MQEESSLPRRERLGRIAEQSLVVVMLAVVSLSATAVITFMWGGAKVWTFVHLLLDDGASSQLAVVKLLEVIDIYLLGTVVLIIAIGLVELFITPLQLPDWLEITNLGDLKGKIIDVIQLLAAIKFLEKLIIADDPIGVLWYGLAVSAVILSLLAVRYLQKQSSR